MPNTPTPPPTRGSAAARSWAASRAAAIGRSVAELRGARGWSAVQLAARTAELGYPITRSTIAKIEGAHRGGRLDVAEVVALAAALEVPPVQLVCPGLPDDELEVLPGVMVSSWQALRWFTGEARGANNPTPTTTALLDAVRARVDARYLVDELVLRLFAAGLSTPIPVDRDEAEAALKRARAQLRAAEDRLAELGDPGAAD